VAWERGYVVLSHVVTQVYSQIRFTCQECATPPPEEVRQGQKVINEMITCLYKPS